MQRCVKETSVFRIRHYKFDPMLPAGLMEDSFQKVAAFGSNYSQHHVKSPLTPFSHLVTRKAR